MWCHACPPVVGFVDAPPVPGRPVAGFVSPPEWAGCFPDAGLRILHVPELSKPLTEVDLSGLAQAELAQVRYRRPGVLGQPLFNWWDRAARWPGRRAGRPRRRP